jgi:hypothetical protein
MKLEFLFEGSSDCPLVRLYDYRPGEVEQLRQACRDLADGRIREFVLHDQPWIEPVVGCQFIWQINEKDIGVKLPARGNPLVLLFSVEAWLEVEGKLLPFTKDSKGFNWLTNEGDVNVLISPNGTW